MCGRTFARMSAVRGRRDDMLIVRGVNLYPSQIEHVLLARTASRRTTSSCVERPEALDEITVHCEPTRRADPEGLAGARRSSAIRDGSASASTGRGARRPARPPQRGQGGARVDRQAR